ncbi:unnamed protein product [Menidia menidia]|uniref:(Atlantic silverside) hypothetical protein n=1 Tax=Menidia menidia TaxID=238744 RepID=A0A8S4BG70_9TELE|nr:unnamed protein product [Menidia menidia]
MSKGNISLRLLNVREEDAGIYTCLVPKLGSKVKLDTVTLVVDRNTEPAQSSENLHQQIFKHRESQYDILGVKKNWSGLVPNITSHILSRFLFSFFLPDPESNAELGQYAVRRKEKPEGSSSVIGSHDPVVAPPGGDALLPCFLDPPLDVSGLTVEWKFNGTQLVHFYRSKSDSDRQRQNISKPL